VAAIVYWLSQDVIGGTAGVVVSFALLIVFSALLYLRSRRTPVNPGNVNEEWTGTLTPPSDLEPVPA
jgi:PiT family inorganic phosphate transporter